MFPISVSVSQFKSKGARPYLMQLSVATGILRDIGRIGGGIGDWDGLQKDGRRQGYNKRFLSSKGRLDFTYYLHVFFFGGYFN